MAAKLSESDVEQLLTDPSVDARTSTAEKIAGSYDAATLSDHEKKLAEEIFTIMCRDAEERVRVALSANLKECAFLPHDIARTLADDVDSVSLPVLQYSTVLTDEDLIEIIQSQGEEKQRAIAGRATVSANVSDALIDTKNEAVVGTLVANEGAEISTPSMQRVLDEFSGSDLIKTSLVRRSELPIEVTERLVTMISSKLQEELVAKHELGAEQINDLIMQTREKATLGLVRGKGRDNDVRRLIGHLYNNDRLTPTIMLRALCMGDLDFFEGSLAVCARVPLPQTRKMLREGEDAVDDILDKADMPKALRPAFVAAIQVADETEYDGGEHDRERFRRRMIERIVTGFDDPNSSMGGDNIDYLMNRLTQIDAGFAQSA